MKVHDLKCWPGAFSAVCIGQKLFEIRRDDRGYEAGDVLHLREWVPVPGWTPGYSGRGDYTGRETRRRVTYLTNDIHFGVRAGFVVMSIAPACPFAGGERDGRGKLTAYHSRDCICEADGVIR